MKKRITVTALLGAADSSFVIKGTPTGIVDKVMRQLRERRESLKISGVELEKDGRVRIEYIDLDDPTETHQQIVSLVKKVVGGGYNVRRGVFHDSTTLGECIFGDDFYNGGVALTSEERWVLS